MGLLAAFSSRKGSRVKDSRRQALEAIPGFLEVAEEFALRKKTPRTSGRNPVTVEKVKRTLLERGPRNGPKLEDSNSYSLGYYLKRFVNKKSELYDADFSKKIRKLAPRWFMSRRAWRKRELLRKARAGEERPGSDFGFALKSYTVKYPDEQEFDADFNRKIRVLAPHWFSPRELDEKRELLRMAQNGESKPKCNSPLYKILVKRTQKRSCYYDIHFDKRIRRAAPGWFKEARRVTDLETHPYWTMTDIVENGFRVSQKKAERIIRNGNIYLNGQALVSSDINSIRQKSILEYKNKLVRILKY